MAAAAREESEPETEHVCARFRGWEVAVAGEGSQNPETSTNARFGVGGTVVAAKDPENEHSCSLSGLRSGGGRRWAVRTPK